MSGSSAWPAPVGEPAVGVRQFFAVLLPVRLTADPPWAAGPLPFELEGRGAGADWRQRMFTPAAARALYERRWHRFTSATSGAMRLDGLELLRTPTAGSPEQGLAVLHFTISGAPLLPVLRALAGRRRAPGTSPLTGALDPAALLAGVADTSPAASPFAIIRPYTVAFFTPGPGDTFALRDPASGELPASADRFLWSLASRSTPVDLPVAPESFPGLIAPANRVSADWSALALRQGAAFLGHRPDPGAGSGDFYDYGARSARTVYLDAVLLGIVQRDHIDELTDDLSAVFRGPGLTRRVAALEQRIALFRSTYWRQHLSAHGPANDILLAFQAQYRLPERFAQILAEAADYARLAQTQESQQIAGALGVLTVLGLPLSTALAVLQVLGDSRLSHLLVALGAALAATAAALTTRYGRLVVSSLRGGRR